MRGNDEGRIFFRIEHNGKRRLLDSGQSVGPSEWDAERSCINPGNAVGARKNELENIAENLKTDLEKLRSIVRQLKQEGRTFSPADVVEEYRRETRQTDFLTFMQRLADTLRAMGKERTAETYHAALHRFKCFRCGIELPLSEMDADLMLEYETYLRRSGISANTSSFYMRNLRAAYNRAVERGLVTQQYPFRHVYTGVDKTMKRAISLKAVRQILQMDLSKRRALAFARDMFLFSFYMRGMSFVDMAYLRKKDLNDGVLSYRRRKTGQQLFIKWEKCMQEIVARYDTGHSPYLLPIISNPAADSRHQYLNALHKVNRHLREIGQKLHLNAPLTTYVARHAWASIARSRKVPLSVISEALGHDSESTTRIYLASFDNMAIDKANSEILKSLF